MRGRARPRLRRAGTHSRRRFSATAAPRDSTMALRDIAFARERRVIARRPARAAAPTSSAIRRAVREAFASGGSIENVLRRLSIIYLIDRSGFWGTSVAQSANRHVCVRRELTARTLGRSSRQSSATSPPTPARRAGPASGRTTARRDRSRTSHLPAPETRRRASPGPARRAARPVRRAAYLPRVARTAITGTVRSASAITARTMSPPWLTSTTSASASSRRHSAIAFCAQPAGESPTRSRRRSHRTCHPRRDRPRPGRRRRRVWLPTPADRPRPRCASAAAPRRRGSFHPRARPQRVGALLDDLAVELLAAEPRAAIAREHRLDETPATDAVHSPAVPARVSAVVGSAISRLSSAIGRGVVVMTCRGRSPRRSPNCSISKVASA